MHAHETPDVAPQTPPAKERLASLVPGLPLVGMPSRYSSRFRLCRLLGITHMKDTPFCWGGARAHDIVPILISRGISWGRKRFDSPLWPQRETAKRLGQRKPAHVPLTRRYFFEEQEVSCPCGQVRFSCLRQTFSRTEKGHIFPHQHGRATRFLAREKQDLIGNLLQKHFHSLISRLLCFSKPRPPFLNGFSPAEHLSSRPPRGLTKGLLEPSQLFILRQLLEERQHD